MTAYLRIADIKLAGRLWLHLTHKRHFGDVSWGSYENWLGRQGAKPWCMVSMGFVEGHPSVIAEWSQGGALFLRVSRAMLGSWFPPDTF